MPAAIERALDWLVGMQSENGGFAAFDADNTHYNLNYIPFADHGALLDPPTSDVTARVVTAARAAWAGRRTAVALERAIAYLRQRAGGRWLLVRPLGHQLHLRHLVGAHGAGAGRHSRRRSRRAPRCGWLLSRQNADGGWGESNDSYDLETYPDAELRAAPRIRPRGRCWRSSRRARAARPPLQRGVEYLLRTQESDGLWSHPSFTAPGFPRVFYLKYHGYCAYFPLWALAAYRRRAESPAP